MGKKYLLDSNILITAHRTLYPFDIAPGFWKQLIDKASNKIIIIEKVSEEILKGEDQLTDWYLENKDNIKVLEIPEAKVIESYGEIISRINVNDQYKETAKREFASIADSWLCAYGHTYNYTLVTNEKYSANIKNRIKIPNVCEEFNIKYINLLQFMREIKIKL